MTAPVRDDTAIKAQTPEGIEYTLYPAGLCARFCAYSIDSLLQGVLLLVFIIVYIVVLKMAAGFWLIFLVRFALDWFYHIVCELMFRGQTPGKRLLGLRVVQQDGSPISPGSSFIRNLLRFADSFIGLFLICFISVAASRGFRRPGDWAAGTLVVYTWQSQIIRQSGKMDWLSGIPPAVPGRALSFEEKQGVLMFARRYPLLGPVRADEIARPLAPDTAESPSAYLLSLARTFLGEA
jgi:uncharacterized RDD family membrane protein YckC